MTVAENYQVVRVTSPDATATPFTVNLPYSVESISDLSLSLLRSDDGAVVSSFPAALNSGGNSVEITNDTGAIVEVIVKRESDLSQDFDPDNQVAIDVRSLEASQDKQTTAIQELKADDKFVTSIDGFTIPSRFARAAKYIYFDETGAPTLVDGPEWDQLIGRPDFFPTSWDLITGKPTNFPTTWDLVANKPSTFPPSAHTHTVAEITDFPTVFPPAPHTHVVADISDFPSEFPPAAHDHAGQNLGNETTPVSTIRTTSLVLPNPYELRAGDVRMLPELGGKHWIMQVYDSIEEDWVKVYRMFYDETAPLPVASIVHETDGSIDVALNLRFGNKSFPASDQAPTFRANDTIAGEPFENDNLQLYFSGAPIWNWSSDAFFCLNPLGTVGLEAAPINIVFTDQVTLGDAKIRHSPDNLEFVFPNGSDVDTLVCGFNFGNFWRAPGVSFNIGSASEPITSMWLDNLVVNNSATFPSSMSFGSITLSSNLTVNGTSEFNDEAIFDGYAEFNDSTYFGAAVQIDGNLNTADIAGDDISTGVSFEHAIPANSFHYASSTPASVDGFQVNDGLDGLTLDYRLDLVPGSIISHLISGHVDFSGNGGTVTLALRRITLSNHSHSGVATVGMPSPGGGVTKSSVSIANHTVASGYLYYLRATFDTPGSAQLWLRYVGVTLSKRVL
ncbi:MAG: hypothetical protein MJH10_09730 [Epibacterium sp.]|nr:hypothetical protein [Epibacterium sp.]NQX73815.1 hypothetical protein [Epibacterium sp.]